MSEESVKRWREGDFEVFHLEAGSIPRRTYRLKTMIREKSVEGHWLIIPAGSVVRATDVDRSFGIVRVQVTEYPPTLPTTSKNEKILSLGWELGLPFIDWCHVGREALPETR